MIRCRKSNFSLTIKFKKERTVIVLCKGLSCSFPDPPLTAKGVDNKKPADKKVEKGETQVDEKDLLAEN